MSERLNGYQARVEDWQNAVYGGEATLSGRLEKVREEHHEAVELLDGLTIDEIDAIPDNDPELARQLAEELTDQIIANLGTIGVLGYQFHELFDAKLEVMHQKYNPAQIEAHMQTGLTRAEAVAYAKTIWQIDNAPKT